MNEKTGSASAAAKKKVIVAGATGFVGQALLEFLRADFQLLPLTRRSDPQSPGIAEARVDSAADAGIEWRRCDLFSLIQCEKALSGADSAVYLVHSMLPSAHLTQGRFEEMDLILADNFARAAAKAGLEQIVYLGGLIPEVTRDLSRHLRSRLEVEETLGARGIPVTALRAGLIIGAGSSSFRMLRAVVERLELIPCPNWSRSLTQPVALADVLALLRYALAHPPRHSRSYDIGAPDVLTYRELLERLARLLGKRRVFFHMPGSSWCKPWLSLVSGHPLVLVSPLVESMRHSMIASDLELQERAGIIAMSLDSALRRAVAEPSPKTALRRWPWNRPVGHDVRSVQRLPLPPGRTARWLAEEYVAWLPKFFRFLLKARSDDRGNLFIRLRFPRLSLLELIFDRERSAVSERQLFYINGGLLVRRSIRQTQRPRLEFRQLLGGRFALVAIHDYRPTLPWPLYNLTQARAHLWVMRRFVRHMQKQKTSG